MAYTKDEQPAGLSSLTSLESDDTVIVGDTSDSSEVVKKITWANLETQIGQIAGNTSVTISETAPSSPSAGNLWFNSTTAKMYIYYTDVDSSQWVSVTSGLPTPSSYTGFVDYNNSGSAITLTPDTWTDVPNDGAGSFTNTGYLPSGVSGVLDTSNGYLDFDDLPLGSELILRNDITVTPNTNNALLEFRYVLGTGANQYELNFFSERLDNGSGVAYQKVTTFPIYMGDTNTKGNPGKLQVRLSSAGTFQNAGVYASMRVRNI